MKSKLIAIPYTIGVIKPHIALKEEKVSIKSRCSIRSLGA